MRGRGRLALRPAQSENSSKAERPAISANASPILPATARMRGFYTKIAPAGYEHCAQFIKKPVLFASARSIVDGNMLELPDNSAGESITLASDLEELERLRKFIDGFCDQNGLPDETRYHLSVALEELVINAIKHGTCQPSTDAIRLSMRMEGGEVRMVLCDTGVSFDPLQAPLPDLTQKLPDRPIGGLGIHLVRCLIPKIRYERRDGRNRLYLTKPVDQDGAFAGQKEE